jgi:hypothetical protein
MEGPLLFFGRGLYIAIIMDRYKGNLTIALHRGLYLIMDK